MKILMRASQSPFDNFSSYDTLLADKIWNNLGNLLFPYSLYRNIISEDVTVDYYAKHSPKDADYIDENYDLLLLPFANAFRSSFKTQLKDWTEIINKVKIPCVVAGIGVQGGLENSLDLKFDFDEDVKKFCTAVASKSAYIGVRGEFTYEYLKRLGFGSVTRIIGCPSMYMFGDQLPEPRIKPYSDNIKVSVNGKNADSDKIKEYLFKNITNDFLFIPQETAELRLTYSGAPITFSSSNIYPLTIDNRLFTEDKVKFCINVPSWLNLLKTVDFSIGTRIHGSAAAVLAGTPAFVIPTDLRIAELARYHNIPYKTSDNFDFSKNIREIYEETDFSTVNQGHKERYDNFVKFLSENGIKPIEQPNTFFDNKISEIDFHQPVQNILKIPEVEVVQRLNQYMGHLTRKISKLEQENKEIQILKKNCISSKAEADSLKEMALSIQQILNKHL